MSVGAPRSRNGLQPRATYKKLFQAAFFFKHAARVKGDGYSILDSLADYSPYAKEPDVSWKLLFELPLETFTTGHDALLATYMKESTSTANKDSDLSTARNHTDNHA